MPMQVSTRAEANRARAMEPLNEECRGGNLTFKGLRLYCADETLRTHVEMGFLDAKRTLFFLRIGDGHVLTGLFHKPPRLCTVDGVCISYCTHEMMVEAFEKLVGGMDAANRSGFPYLGYFKKFDAFDARKMALTIVLRYPYLNTEDASVERFLEMEIEAFDMPPPIRAAEASKKHARAVVDVDDAAAAKKKRRATELGGAPSGSQ